MEIVWIILSFLLMAIGLVGCFINRVPGPILAYAGILLLNFCTDIQVFDTMSLVICGLAVVLCKVADMFVPKVAGLISEYGKSGKWGCVIGSMLGVLGVWPTISSADDNATVIMTMVLVLVVFPFVFAYIGESVSRKSLAASFRPALAAFAAYLIGTCLKLAVTLYCIYVAFEGYGNSGF